MLWLYFLEGTEIFSRPLRLLKIAPEYPLYEAFKATPAIDYVTAGLDAEFIRVEMDLVYPAFKPDLFEVIICCHVLEHIIDDVAAMGELWRVLKPGRLAFLQSLLDYHREVRIEDPNCRIQEARARVFGQSDHVRIYGREYKNRLEEAGFTVMVEEYAKTLPPDTIRRYGLIADEAL